MPRTVVYDGPHLQQIFDKVAAKSPTRRAIAPAARRSIRREAEESIASATPHTEVIVGTLQDNYLARIAKYVPAETITLTMLGFGAFSPHGTAVWFWVGAGALTNVIYLAGLATGGPESQRPRWFFYVLSALAYAMWAIATIDAVTEAAHISGGDLASRKAFVLAFASFVIPAADLLLEHVDRRWWGSLPVAEPAPAPDRDPVTQKNTKTPPTPGSGERPGDHTPAMTS